MKKPNKRVRVLATQFRRLYESIGGFREEKTKVSGRLKKLRVDRFEFKDGKRLTLERSSDRVVTLKDLGRLLKNLELAKKIWNRFPKRTSEYYTIVPTKLQVTP